MLDIYIKILPIIIIFILGKFLQQLKVFTSDDAGLFLKLVFYIALPSLIIQSLADLQIDFKVLSLPLIAVLNILIIYAVSIFASKFLNLSKQSLGTFLIGTMIANVGFTYPFVFTAYGEQGLAQSAFYDFTNGLLTFTFIYYIACKYGSNNYKNKDLYKKFFKSPPIWAIVFALFLNFTNIQLPNVANDLLSLFGGLMTPLIMLSLGINFNPKITSFKPAITAIFIRMFFGLFLGMLFSIIFNLQGVTRSIALISSSAPVGFNTLTFSSIEKLDVKLASTIASYAVIIGLIFIPILIAIL